MSGAILQLQHIGEEEIYFINKPSVNVFKYNYPQYYNFAKNIIELQIQDKPEFGKKNSVVIPKYGDFLNGITFEITLPPLIKNSGSYACWTNTLGYAIFDEYIDLQIGGISWERLWAEQLDIDDELTNFSQKDGNNLSILKSELYTSIQTNANKSIKLTITLPFWLSKKLNLSLELSKIKDEIKIFWKLRQFDNVIHYDGNIPPSQVEITNFIVYAEYIYVDDRLRINNKTDINKNIIITQTHFKNIEFIPQSVNFYKSLLTFSGLCKELLIVAKDSSSIENNDLLNYSRPSDSLNIIDSMNLNLDNNYRYDISKQLKSESIFRTILCKKTHSVIPTKYIYCMPFSEYPELNQPLGFLNLGLFDNVELVLNLNNDNDTFLYIFCKSINILEYDPTFDCYTLKYTY